MVLGFLQNMWRDWVSRTNTSFGREVFGGNIVADMK